jgi:hypothetical protein
MRIYNNSFNISYGYLGDALVEVLLRACTLHRCSRRLILRLFLLVLGIHVNLSS